MKTKDTHYQNFALILVLAGIVSYIAVDSNLFPVLTQGFKSRMGAVSSEVLTPEQNLKEYSNRIAEELEEVEGGIKGEKKKLNSLQTQVAEYEEAVRVHKKSLDSVKNQINALTKLRQSMDGARGPASSSSFTELASSISDLGLSSVAIVPIKYENQEFMRLKAKISYAGEQGIYLTPSASRQASRFTEGAISFGYRSIKLAYNSADNQISERLGVIKNYLSKKYGSDISVSSYKVDENLELTDGLELWMSSEGRVQ